MSPSGSAPPSSCALSPRDYDAVLFDLDGVLTRTASVHAAAWKRLFDEFVKKRSDDTGEPFVPFDIDTDYRRHVDGKPRYDGVTAFLSSRDIGPPQRAQEDGPGVQSVRALGNLKDKYFLEHLEQRGVELYDAAITLVHQIKKWIGTFAAALGGLDALVFPGGIGENAPAVRARVCDGLAFLGIEIEEKRNVTNAGVISTETSRVAVRVMHTDEEV